MPDEALNEEAIFQAARRIERPDARAAYLDQVCGSDGSLRERVLALLGSPDEVGQFLETPPSLCVEAGATTGPRLMERPGTQIDAYKLLEQIGEGGMGVVFRAEQTQPIRRTVALKVIKPGMGSRQIIARFEAERQALAMMDHVNIARVLDAGTTRSGLPYFVMELVHGVPITRYCDDNHLTPRERLELFIPVCQAIQHAHQKGIIHRDLKPSNILVTLYDDNPVPKVIDFGVAKAVGSAVGGLTDKTLITGFGNIVGTLEYMSPEQAEMDQLDIDTKSDIYSLGVLLYELLTGSPPFSRKELEDAGMLEMLRVIREQEPPKPSTKLSTAEGLPTLAANRGTEPAKLTKLMRGELDWVVMKALEKDRNRRYETASALALDVQHYLADEPVQACPPSLSYRLRKFARRNRLQVAATAVLLSLLLAGNGFVLWHNRELDKKNQELLAANEAEREAKEIAEQRKAETAAALEFVVEKIFAAARPEGRDGGLGHNVTLRQAIEAALPYVEDNFKDQPLIEALLRQALGRSFLYLGDAKTATEQFEAASRLFIKNLGATHPEAIGSLQGLANGYFKLGRAAEALQLREEALKLYKTTNGPDHPDTLVAMHNLANSYFAAGRQAEAIELRKEVLALRRAKIGPEHPQTLNTMDSPANGYTAIGRHPEALELREQVLAVRRKNNGADHLDTLNSMHALAISYAELGRHEEALKLREHVLAARKVKLPADHPETLLSMKTLANSYNEFGRYAEALELDEQLFAIQRAKLGDTHADTLSSMKNLAMSYSSVGRHEDALRLSKETLALRKRTLSDNHPDILASMNDLALRYYETGEYREALKLHKETLELEEQRAATQPANAAASIDIAGSCCNIAHCHAALDEPATAVEWCGKAITRLEEVLAKVPAHEHARSYLRNAHWARAKAFERLARFDEADIDWERAIDLCAAPKKAGVTLDRDAWLNKRSPQEPK